MNVWEQEFMDMARRFYRTARDRLLEVEAIIQGTYFIPETEDMKALKKECNDTCTNILFTLNYIYPESEKLEVKQQCPECGWSINNIVCKVCGHKWEAKKDGS